MDVGGFEDGDDDDSSKEEHEEHSETTLRILPGEETAVRVH